jgi:uncharacterized protein (TIGR03435 family)
MRNLSLLCLAALALAGQTGQVAGQGAPPAARFEVAAVKRAPEDRQPGGVRWYWGDEAGRVSLTGVSVKQLLLRAYSVEAYQVTGPDWLASERYDVAANVPAGARPEEIRRMFQALLAERFHLTLHRETRVDSVYELTAGSGGVKLKPADPPSPGFSLRIHSDKYQLKGNLPLATLVANLSTRLDHPVLDKTGLKDVYEIDLTWARDVSAAPAMAAQGDAAASDPVPSIFAALKQVGLKLTLEKTSMEILIVDSAERIPTEN